MAMSVQGRDPVDESSWRQPLHRGHRIAERCDFHGRENIELPDSRPPPFAWCLIG